MLEVYCAQPSCTIDAPGPSNPVSAEQASMGGLSDRAKTRTDRLVGHL